MTTSISRRMKGRWAVLAAAAVTGLMAFMLMAGGAIQTTQAAPAQITQGSLEWGVRSSFRNYVTGPIAHGAITTGGGATQAGGGFSFPVSGGTYDPDTNTLSVSFSGSVHFTGHDYGKGNLLDLRISNLRVELNGASGSLIGDVASRTLASVDPNAELGPIVNYSGVTIANLSGASVQAGNSFSWSGVSASLASGAVVAFANFYQAGEPLDSLSITIQTAQAQATATATTAPTNTSTPVPTSTTTASSATATPVPSASATATATGTAMGGTPAATAVATSTPAPAGSSQAQSGGSIVVPAVGDAGLAAHK